MLDNTPCYFHARAARLAQQIALFVIPFIVTLGWILGKPLSLLFDPFESIVLFLSGTFSVAFPSLFRSAHTYLQYSS